MHYNYMLTVTSILFIAHLNSRRSKVLYRQEHLQSSESLHTALPYVSCLCKLEVSVSVLALATLVMYLLGMGSKSKICSM